MVENIALCRKAVTPCDVGVPTIRFVELRTVYAEAKSVTRAEFYRADANGRRADIVFLINADDWETSEGVKYNGLEYDIIREYRPTYRKVEITCARR